MLTCEQVSKDCSASEDASLLTFSNSIFSGTLSRDRQSWRRGP